MSRFDGYNRHDFHHPRTSREAFGTGFHVEKKPSVLWEITKWVAYYAVMFILLLCLTGAV
jgi:hypothetical protein